MEYCKQCGHVHESVMLQSKADGELFWPTNSPTLARLRDRDGRYHNEACALVESLAYFLTSPREEWN